MLGQVLIVDLDYFFKLGFFSWKKMYLNKYSSSVSIVDLDKKNYMGFVGWN